MGKTLKYRSLRGMPDILPGEAALFRFVEEKAREAFRAFEFCEIRTPLLEEAEVFTRSIGEDTDIVEKEMYSFPDRSGRTVSIRPEGTASIIRAYIEHALGTGRDVVKLFYIGPMFRSERPQKGRLRQFHQIGAEIIGNAATDLYYDAELVLSARFFLRSVGIKNFEIYLNSLGCGDDRLKYKKELASFLSGKGAELCENCGRRARANVLRVLDCKREKCRKAMEKAPAIVDSLCGGCLKQYEGFKDILRSLKVAFKERTDLVRGLDYYTGIIFEIVHPALGAQDAIAAGGRYDGLTKQMGGPDVGATGYAVGVERLLLLIKKDRVPPAERGVLVVPLDDACCRDAFGVVESLREAGVPCGMDNSGRSLKAVMRKADKERRKKVIIIGEEELRDGSVLVRDMESGEQKTLPLGKAADEIRKACKGEA